MITIATGTEKQKFASMTFGRQPTGDTSTMMIQAPINLSEASDIAEIFGSTSAMKNIAFGLGTQFSTINLPSAPTTIKQKVNFKFTITGQKRKKMIVRIPLHFDGTVMDDIVSVKTQLEAMTLLSIGEITKVDYVQEGVVR